MQPSVEPETMSEQTSCKTRWPRSTRLVLGIGVAVLALALIGREAYAQLDSIRAIQWRLGWLTALALICIMLGQCTVGSITFVGLKALGAKPSWGAVLNIHLVSQPLKYLPAGGLFNVAAQTVALGRLRSVGAARAAKAIGVMMITLCAAAGAWSGLGLWFDRSQPTWAIVVGLAAVLLCLVSIRSHRVGNWLIRRAERLRASEVLSPEDAALPSTQAAAKMALLGLAAFGLFGMSLVLITAQLTVISPDVAFRMVGVMAASWLLGFVSFVVPAGIGVRDAAMMALLLPILGEPWAVVVPVLSRVLWVLADLCNMVFSLVVARRRIPQPGPVDAVVR